MILTEFKKIASNIDVKPLIDQVYKNWFLFNDNQTRQKYPGSAHGDTESIYLRWARGQTVQAAFTEIHAYNYPALETISEANGLIDLCFKLVGGKELGRVMIVNLKPNGFITPHADEGAYADHYERFHLSLESEDGNIFFVGEPDRVGEFVHMRPGELWWFNHKNKHWVFNNSEKPRLHMILDIVSPANRRERESA